MTVLYIAGSGRSGSTLLERILGDVPGVFAVGELVTALFCRGLVLRERCGCGEPFLECPFWCAVGERAYGGWDIDEMIDASRQSQNLVGHRHLPWLLWPGLRPDFRRRLSDFSGFLGQTYYAIAEETGARVIVDASKFAAPALVLQAIPGVDVRVLHLVRDPRGVAASSARLTARTHALGEGKYMRRLAPWRAGMRWSYVNLAVDSLAAARIPRMYARYEDLIRDPHRVVTGALDLAGLDVGPTDLDFIHNDTVDLSVSHGVSGNPVRFDTGPQRLRVDESWRQRLSVRDRALVRAITGPLDAIYRLRS